MLTRLSTTFAIFALALMASPSVLVSSAQTPSADVQAEPRADGSIKVHGRWEITVRNTDGSVASRTSFDNALTQAGAANLAGLLAGAGVVVSPVIELTGSNQAHTIVLPPFGAAPASNIWNTLTVTAQTSGEPRLILSGVATTSAGEIRSVGTSLLAFCRSQSSPCHFPVPIGFGSIPLHQRVMLTEHTLDAPITVSAGQVVTVTVTISFSS